MKKVLIPTDLSVESLQLLEYAVLNYPGAQLEIVLVYGFKLPDTKWGLLHFSRLKETNKIVSDEFLKAKKAFAREYSEVVKHVSIEMFTGSNSYAFKNFLDNHVISDAIIPQGKFLDYQKTKCFDPIPFMKKNIENIAEVPLGSYQTKVSRPFSFAAMLNL